MGRRRNIRNVRGKQFRNEHGKFEKGTIFSKSTVTPIPKTLSAEQSQSTSDGEIEELVDDIKLLTCNI